MRQIILSHPGVCTKGRGFTGKDSETRGKGKHVIKAKFTVWLSPSLARAQGSLGNLDIAKPGIPSPSRKAATKTDKMLANFIISTKEMPTRKERGEQFQGWGGTRARASELKLPVGSANGEGSESTHPHTHTDSHGF